MGLSLTAFDVEGDFYERLHNLCMNVVGKGTMTRSLKLIGKEWA